MTCLQEYMLGDKNQSIFPVAFSLMASFITAISMFGLSSEVYTRGTQFSVIVVSYVIATPVIGYLYLPVFFKLGNLSLYEVVSHTYIIKYNNIISLHCSAFAVLRNTIWTFNASNYVFSVQRTNDIVHGHRIVRPSTDFRSRNRITSVCFHCTRGIGVCVLFYDGWNKSSHRN